MSSDIESHTGTLFYLTNIFVNNDFFLPPNVVPNRSQTVGKAKIHWNTLPG